MPKAYVKMRDKFIDDGMTVAAAKAKAARIYNARRKPGVAPVTGREPGEKRVGIRKRG